MVSGSFDPQRVIRVLATHGVAYVLIGGLAAVIHGSPLPTAVVDIVPEQSDDNLARLVAALSELDARIRTGEAGGVVVPLSGAFLAAQPRLLNLTTDAGDVDVVITPAGFDKGYTQLIGRSTPLVIVDDVTTDVAHLDAIIESKEAANRAKDRYALPHLYALGDELAGP